MPIYLIVAIACALVYFERSLIMPIVGMAVLYFMPQLIAPAILILIVFPDILASKPSAPAKK